MMRINLLPHREVRRKQQQTQFFIALGVVALAGAGLTYGVYYFLSNDFDEQVSRNKYLTEEIAKVDKDIAEINRLKDQRDFVCLPLDRLINFSKKFEAMQVVSTIALPQPNARRQTHPL